MLLKGLYTVQVIKYYLTEMIFRAYVGFLSSVSE